MTKRRVETLALEPPDDHERDQRHREHGRQLRLAEHVAELVAREAEQVAADERRARSGR